MKKLAMIVCIFCLAACEITINNSEQALSIIKKDLNSKKYIMDSQQLVLSNLILPEKVNKALEYLQVSPYTYLRNEVFARHGYRFSNIVLAQIFSQATWYKVDPDFSFTGLSPLEEKNIDFIKQVEDEYDYIIIADWINEKGYIGDSEYYLSDNMFTLPNKISLSLQHLKIKLSDVYINEIFARKGYDFKKPQWQKIFRHTQWYVSKGRTQEQAKKSMNQYERVNIEIMQQRRWVDLLDSLKISLPQGVTAIPTLGYDSMFLKNFTHANESYHFSAQALYFLPQFDPARLDEHTTDTDDLLNADIIAQIEMTSDPLQKFVLFFENKKYQDYTDKIIFNHSDMQEPSYLKGVAQQLGTTYLTLLRKEIHARKGAKFSDPVAGPIFRACSWYQKKYSLSPDSITRFPEQVKFTQPELYNFSLMEGEDLHSKLNEIQDGRNYSMLIDLFGNTYYIMYGQIANNNSRLTLGLLVQKNVGESISQYGTDTILENMFALIMNERPYTIEDVIDKIVQDEEEAKEFRQKMMEQRYQNYSEDEYEEGC